MKSILIYTTIDSPKLDYVLDFIFYNVVEIDYAITKSFDSFKNDSSSIKINYSDVFIQNTLTIQQSDYFEKFNLNNNPKCFSELSFENFKSNFDVFAAIFFIVSRAEEYRKNSLDSHGRFQSSSSILAKNNWLQKPIVDYWIIQFKQKIEEEWGIIIPFKSKMTFRSTIDVDHIYAFKGKPFFIQMGSLMKDLVKLKFKKIKDRFSSRDPFDTFDFILELHRKYNLELTAFILTANRGRYDKSFSSKHIDFVRKVKRLKEYCDVGIHPSYASESNAEKLRVEKENLEHVLGESVVLSRQHFVRLQFPNTYRALIDVGVECDYSMGYPEVSGYRAGTSRMFYWYDILNDCKTSLRIVPFQLMDVTLKNYESYGTKEALYEVKKIFSASKQTNGQLCVIWHNSSFYNNDGWKGWSELYKEILLLGSQYENEALDLN